jgi:hypothetical protein
MVICDDFFTLIIVYTQQKLNYLLVVLKIVAVIINELKNACPELLGVLLLIQEKGASNKILNIKKRNRIK